MLYAKLFLKKGKHMKKFFKDFKAFISRGSVLNMAVGIIIGASFSAIVNSLVNDIIMPPISLLLGNEVSQLKWVLRPAVLDVDGVTVLTKEIAMTWGLFIQAIINFLLVALALFTLIRVFTTITEKAEALKAKLIAEEPVVEEVVEEEPVTPEEVVLLREIRDALNKK